MHPRRLALLLVAACGALSACSGGGDSAAPAVGPTTVTQVPVPPRPPELWVKDVAGRPIVGAVITVTNGETLGSATTGDDGHASMSDMPSGEVSVSVTAKGFEPHTFRSLLPNGIMGVTLRAEGEWAIGRAIVLGTRALERAGDGTTLTFSVDVAVVGEHSTAIETLTSAAFEVLWVDCGWGGPRECASDAAGKATGSGGYFSPDGPAQAFALQPPSARRPYLVGVLVERSNAIRDWDMRAPALKSFFMTLGGNDAASLSSAEAVDGATRLTVLGPYTSDGRTYLEAIDRLAGLANERPELVGSLLESLYRADAARSGAMAGAEPTVLVLPTPWMTVEDVALASETAQRLGVRISSVVSGNYGFPEMAVRTGGFVAEIADPRQLGIVFGAMDALLAGTMPFYRMEFRIRGAAANTFVSGGNAKVQLRVRVPTSLPSNGVFFSLDVAIP